MITPISSTHAVDAHQASQPPAPKPQPQVQTPKSGAVDGDQVTLKNAGQIDHDGDGK